MDFALTAARLRPRVGIDDAIGGSLALVALLLTLLIGIHDSDRPLYGPIDEATHTAYVLAVAQNGVPPLLGRDRAFTRPASMAPRDVRIPAPDVGSAALPLGPFGELPQTEAIQPPMYYYAAAPVTWFVSGRDQVVAIRLFNVFLCLCAIAMIFLAVRDLSGSALGGGVGALLMASAGGMIDIQSYVTNGAMMFALGTAALWLTARGIRARRLTWPLVAVTAGLSITHTIVVPLAAICLLAPAAVQVRAEGWGVWRGLTRRILVAAIPLTLWVLSNLWRYHWITPRSTTAGPGYVPSTTAVDFQQFASTWWTSFVGSVQEPFHWWVPTPFVYDFRPLVTFLVLTLVGIGALLLRGRVRERQAVAFWLIALAVSQVTVFSMLYLAVVVTGGGDFVYRYFTAEQAAAACLAGTVFGTLFGRPNVQRAATIVAGLALAYWTYQASPL